MEYVLGVDIGTGSVKAVAVNLQGRSFQDCQYEYPLNVPKPGYSEQDPEQVWTAFVSSIKFIVDKTRSQPLAISLSSAMHSLIVVSENGSPLAPMMTWADNRSAQIATRLKNTDEGLLIYEATGTPIHAMSPLCKIIWIRENDPELFNNAYKYISIKEYIWHKLFNEFTIDHSIASCTGLFDIVDRKWHGNALKLAGVTASSLSEPVPTDYFKNLTNESFISFLNPGIPVVIGASDGCLANLGSLANKPGIAAVTVGTSGAVRVASSKPLPNSAAMTFSYILDKDTYICGGPINNGGIALQWWLKNFSAAKLSDNDYEHLFKEIISLPPGNNGLIFLPYLTGERAPLWDSESCGTFFGIKLHHTKADFSRAVLEGICYALKDVLEAVQENAEPIVQINVSGGFTRSDAWVQILADITGKKLAIAQADDASAIGAAFLALKNIGALNEYTIDTPSSTKTFIPNKDNTAIYHRGFIIYKQLYVDLKESMHHIYLINGTK